MADADTDRNLLFGVLAVQHDLIDSHQFADACAGWAVRKDKPLAEILIDRGWITDDDRRDVERFLGRKLKRHGGDLRASLAAVADVAARNAMLAVDDPEVRNSLSSLPPAAGYVLIETLISPTQQRSRYRLTRLHAEGGLGKVWVAHDSDLNRDVALKEIRPEQAGHPEAWRRFLKEAQVTGQLEHPGIVPVYELARRPEDDQPFYTMRFVKGGTLRQAIARYHERPEAANVDPLDRFKLLQSFVAACQAVGYAHSRGVIHRDLKPENVVLDDYGVVMVLDWGLARMVNRREEDVEILPGVSVTDEATAEATSANALIGTPAYMAPEQAEGRNDLVDARTDVYGLGAILFEILTGRPPHEGADIADLVRRIATGDTPRVRQIDASIPQALDAICGRAMAWSRAERYSSASDLADDVQRWLVDEPVSAFREGLSRRLARWWRRNRSWMQAGVAALFLVALVATVSAFAINGARRSEKKSLDTATAALASERNALVSERLAKAEAEANFQTARKAVQDYLTGVSENTLLKQQGRADLRALRKELLQGALRYYQGFISRYATDPKLQRELADAYFKVGNITAEIGSKEEALRSYERTIAIRQRLADANPIDTQLRRDLANSHHNVGILQSATGRPLAALQGYERALSIRQKLVDENPTVTQFRRDLANTHNNIGILQSEAGHQAAAMQSNKKALAIRQKLADDNPTVNEFGSDLAVSHINIGVGLNESGDAAGALQSFERALAIQQTLADKNPAVTEFAGNLAINYNNIALLQRTAGLAAAALRSNERALEIRQKLADANPTVNEFRRNLAKSHNDIGGLQNETGNAAAALRSYERALAIQQTLADANPTVTPFRDDLAVTHHNIGIVQSASGDPVAALRSFQRALAIHQSLVDANPAAVNFRSSLAQSHNHIRALQHAAGDAAAALRSYERALAVRRKLVDDNPANIEFRSALASSHHNVGVVQGKTRALAAALRSNERALAIRQKLADENPAVTKFRINVAESFFSIGVIQRASGAAVEALRSLESALAIRQKLADENPAITQFRGDLATGHLNVGAVQLAIGDPAAALRSFQQALVLWDGLNSSRPPDLYNKACLLALISKISGPKVEGRDAADRAMRVLRQAVAAGYRNAANMAKDSDLDPLRSRPDFQSLMMDFGFPVNPFARGK